MNAFDPSRLSASREPILGQRVRELRLALGLGTDALARRARISRTTLHHIEKGQTPFPRLSTLKKLAAALHVPIDELMLRPGQPETSASPHLQHAFDRQTNPAVDQVLAQRPRLFDDWTQGDWEEMYSEFGMGGALNARGVIAAAVRINRKRETLRQLSIVLETDLEEVAAAIVERLYTLAQLRSEATGSPSRPARASKGYEQHPLTDSTNL